MNIQDILSTLAEAMSEGEEKVIGLDEELSGHQLGLILEATARFTAAATCVVGGSFRESMKFSFPDASTIAGQDGKVTRRTAILFIKSVAEYAVEISSKAIQ